MKTIQVIALCDMPHIKYNIKEAREKGHPTVQEGDTVNAIFDEDKRICTFIGIYRTAMQFRNLLNLINTKFLRF